MSAETKAEPALTPEEWADALNRQRPDLYRADDDTPEAYHAAVALYLHGQPFGFTWEDVDLHERRIQDLEESLELAKVRIERDEPIRRGDRPLSAELDAAEYRAEIAAHSSQADRIAALLPPREQ